MNSLVAQGHPIVAQVITACEEALIDRDAEGETGTFAPRGVVRLHNP